MITRNEFENTIFNVSKKLLDEKKTPRIFTLSIKKRFDGDTLIEVYCQSFPHVECDFWRDKIESGNLTLDGCKVSPQQKVKAGQITQHSVPPKLEPSIDTTIELISATHDFWVISKPSPLPVHAGGRYQKHTLTSILQLAFPNQSFHLINRLDANTTGIVLVALNKKSANLLGKQFEEKRVKKTYLALVEGQPNQDSFTSSKSIGKLKTAAGGRQIEEGKDSMTEFEIIKKFTESTLLKVTPHSGRTNQIRLHLADLGHPIVGDLGHKNPQYFENNPLTYSTDSLFLHAWKLSFYHPVTKQKVTFESSPNKKWSAYF